MEPSNAPAIPPRIVVVGTKGRRVLDAAKANVQTRDFRSPALLTEADLRRLRAQQGEFARHFAAKVAAPDLQRILREVEPADLAASLKGPKGETMLKNVTSVMSKRAAESMVEEIAMLAPVRPRDQEAAQDRVMAVVRRLEEQGEVNLDNGDQADGA